MQKSCCKLGRNRKLYNHRFRILFAIFVALTITYQVIPKLLFKTPWTHMGWKDTDFRLNVDENEIIILRFTSLWSVRYNPEVITSEKCPYLQPSSNAPSNKVFDIPCRLTYDRRYLRASDALVFHSFDLTREEIPKQRAKDQIWVYLQQESPIYTKLNLHEYPNVFNWTMTYRRDSDVYHSYGQVVPFTSDLNSKVNSNLAKRPKSVAWIVSSCDSDSKREFLVKELQSYIPIDIFGWCGEDCPNYDGNCYEYVKKTYKFYLSFENSLCTDYITEKFFNALRNNLVPVVYGGARSEDYAAIAPEGSYIDARKFSSPKHLAEFLTYLDKHDDEYMKYFEWKKTHKVIYSQGWCNLCQKVFEHLQLTPVEKRSNKWYRDIYSWWNYMSYDTNVEEDEHSMPSQLSVIGPSYYYKLGAPSCAPPIKNLTGMDQKYVNFEPGILNGKAIYKAGRWVKEQIFE